jgi:hypothetical protein
MLMQPDSFYLIHFLLIRLRNSVCGLHDCRTVTAAVGVGVWGWGHCTLVTVLSLGIPGFLSLLSCSIPPGGDFYDFLSQYWIFYCLSFHLIWLDFSPSYVLHFHMYCTILFTFLYSSLLPPLSTFTGAVYYPFASI